MLDQFWGPPNHCVTCGTQFKICFVLRLTRYSTVYAIQCHVCSSGHLLYFEVYNNDQQLHHQCHLMTLDIRVYLLIYWRGYVQQCYEEYTLCHTMIYNLTEMHTNSYTNEHLYMRYNLAFVCSTISSPLQITTQDYHLKFPSVRH